MLRVLLALIVLSLGSKAGAETPESLFQQYADQNKRMAMGLAWSVDGAAPTIVVAGPTRPGGPAVGPDARWHIGSITKSFTAALALSMAKDSIVSLDEPLGSFLPDQPGSDVWHSATLRAVLSHTSGLPVAFDRPVMAGGSTGDDPQDRINRLSSMWDADPQGVDDFAYSNVGYVYAGAALEWADGSRWDVLLQDRILGPAGITTAGFGAPNGDGDPWGHRRRFGFTTAIDPNREDADNPAWLGPAGTLHMSIGDLHRWAETLRLACTVGTPAISQESCETMTTPVSKSYGLGLIIQDVDEETRFVWHNGSNSQWYAIMGFSPEAGISIAVTLNRNEGALADQLLREVVGMLMQD
ncbi:MAG: serine hydrolase domain-containing protein [Pseudomonadota bacterium]